MRRLHDWDFGLLLLVTRVVDDRNDDLKDGNEGLGVGCKGLGEVEDGWRFFFCFCIFFNIKVGP